MKLLSIQMYGPNGLLLSHCLTDTVRMDVSVSLYFFFYLKKGKEEINSESSCKCLCNLTWKLADSQYLKIVVNRSQRRVFTFKLFILPALRKRLRSYCTQSKALLVSCGTQVLSLGGSRTGLCDKGRVVGSVNPRPKEAWKLLVHPGKTEQIQHSKTPNRQQTARLVYFLELRSNTEVKCLDFRICK